MRLRSHPTPVRILGDGTQVVAEVGKYTLEAETFTTESEGLWAVFSAFSKALSLI